MQISIDIEPGDLSGFLHHSFDDEVENLFEKLADRLPGNLTELLSGKSPAPEGMPPGIVSGDLANSPKASVRGSELELKLAFYAEFQDPDLGARKNNHPFLISGIARTLAEII